MTTDDFRQGLPLPLAEELAQLSFLNDTQLWQAACQVAPAEKNDRIQEMVLKQQAERLTDTEAQEVQQLQEYAHRLMLIRAEATVLLKQRGYDISALRQSV